MADINEVIEKIERLTDTLNGSVTMLPINNGQQQSSYREFEITLKAGEVYTLNNPFNYFRCLSATSTFDVAWSTNTGRTNFESGLGIKFNSVIPYAQIFAPENQGITLKVGAGIGYFDDSRLSVTGNVRTEPAQYNGFSAATLTIADGSVTVPAAQQIVIQNTGGNVMYIGGTGTDGLQLQPQGTFEYALATDLTVYGTDGDTLAVGSFD